MRKWDWIGSLTALTVVLTAFSIWGASCEGNMASQCIDAGGTYTHDTTSENGSLETCEIP